ncbi:hypothetical protein MTR_8g465170 [Medicago truncatula]|uniref:Uncharacterized protein n=1 Tax=Medicago truncatula TaxID=3880 RepID=A0A072TQX1_MEDTR|nr:hypothetical protein MTR_8g465170 [Medicago truncatula]
MTVPEGTTCRVHNNIKNQGLSSLDQDHALVRALVEVMHKTHHGLRTIHLLQNEIKHA